jgi:tetratricopeptide (TPR) repeat protein
VLARQGEPELALEKLTNAYELLKQVAEPTSEAGPLAVAYGTVMLNLGRYDEAAAAARTALAQLPNPANSAVAANLHDMLGKVHYHTGQLTQSLEQFEIALNLRLSVAHQKGLIKSYSNLAVVYGHQRRYSDTLQANQAALKIAESIGDTIALGMLYNNMAVDAVEQGDFEQAIDFHNHSLALHEKMGDFQGLALAHRNLGEVYRYQERFDLATEHVRQAIELARQASDEDTIIGGVVALAEVHFAQGDLEEALMLCRESLDRATRIHNMAWRPVSLQLMGSIYHSLRRYAEARVSFDEASQIWREREAWIDLFSTLLSWAKMERDADQPAQARELWARAVALAKDIQAGELLAQAQELQSEFTAQPNNVEEAR